MPGQRFRGGYHDFTIATGGVQVFPRLVAAEHRNFELGNLVRSGLRELDELMGGGLAAGSSTLVLGPAGTGKSLLVMQYLAAAVARNERAALFVFDEELGLLFARAKQLGIDLAKMRDGGQLFVEQMDAAELSPGEFAHRVRTCVDQEGIRTVAIDSLNGYQMAMPEEQFLILHLHELLQYLNRQGASTFLTVAQHGMVGEMQQPIDATYLADTVIVLRYFEAIGHVRRAISLGQPSFPEEPPAGDYVEICVSDTGSGMTDEVRRKVFEPFFTTKEIGKGSGLGLSQVLGFAKQSNGGVRIDSTPGTGAKVCIYLPRSEAKVRANGVATRAPGTNDVHRGGDVLLVDDDNAVRQVVASMLRDLGYRVREAGSGGAALDFLDSGGAADIVVMDFAMPGMNGAEVARRARVMRPGLPVLFVTGFADRSALVEFRDAHVIGKPFTRDELGNRIRGALDGAMPAETPSVGPLHAAH